MRLLGQLLAVDALSRTRSSDPDHSAVLGSVPATDHKNQARGSGTARSLAPDSCLSVARVAPGRERMRQHPDRSLPLVALLAVWAMSCSRPEPPSLETLIDRYIEAANRHDIAAVRAMTAEDAEWRLGPYVLRGREEMMAPLAFDGGAHTVLEATKVVADGATVDCDLVERNDVIEAFGIPELHHFARFIFRSGLIFRIAPRRPPSNERSSWQPSWRSGSGSRSTIPARSQGSTQGESSTTPAVPGKRCHH